MVSKLASLISLSKKGTWILESYLHLRDYYLFASLFITLAIPILRKALIFKIVTR
jgi:hypothetical protein